MCVYVLLYSEDRKAAALLLALLIIQYTKLGVAVTPLIIDTYFCKVTAPLILFEMEMKTYLVSSTTIYRRRSEMCYFTSQFTLHASAF